MQAGGSNSQMNSGLSFFILFQNLMSFVLLCFTSSYYACCFSLCTVFSPDSCQRILQEWSKIATAYKTLLATVFNLFPGELSMFSYSIVIYIRSIVCRVTLIFCRWYFQTLLSPPTLVFILLLVSSLFIKQARVAFICLFPYRMTNRTLGIQRVPFLGFVFENTRPAVEK